MIIFNTITMSIFTRACLNHVLPLSMLLRRSEDRTDELLIARLRASFSVAWFWMGSGRVVRDGEQNKCTKTDPIARFIPKRIQGVKVLTHNLADHHQFRTLQIHAVFAIYCCLFFQIPSVPKHTHVFQVSFLHFLCNPCLSHILSP